MPDFNVDVTRVGYGFATIPVKNAKDVVEAEERALDDAGNYTFSEKSSSYELTHGSSAPDQFEALPERTMVIGVSQTHDFSLIPSWTQLTIGPALARKLSMLAATCAQLKAESICIPAYELAVHPVWGPEYEDKNGYELGVTRFHINEREFWFAAPTQDPDKDIETIAVSIPSLFATMKDQADGIMFFARNPDELQREYEDQAVEAALNSLDFVSDETQNGGAPA